jgi:predicted hotdog family 3-hydroxylacyl-ACP dehydratase
VSAGFPHIAELVPHAAPMLLLDRVVEHDAQHTVCIAEPSDAALFADSGGRVPSWIAIETIAQCAAAHGGIAARARGERPQPGLLLGTRRMDLHVAEFDPHQALRVTARHHRGESALVAFDGEIHSPDGTLLANGRVNLYILKDWSELGDPEL